MKLKKNHVGFLIILIIVLLFYLQPPKEIYQFEKNKFFYSEDRETPDYKIFLSSENSTFKIYEINFPSRNFLDNPTQIYGLLFMPNYYKDVPALIYLPGGGMRKEQRYDLGSKIVDEGYAFFVIDQRGIGQTGGAYLSFEQDYQVFAQGKEPIQHLSVYDGLAAFDVLREIDGIDENKIAIGGESMGGRYALIAGALDKRLNGVIVFSSSGFHIQEEQSVGNDYLLSIDPDRYVLDIFPRKLVMLHSSNDSVVKIQDARFTFDLAKEPKRFYQEDKCQHGYCEEAFEDFLEGLKFVLTN